MGTRKFYDGWGKALWQSANPRAVLVHVEVELRVLPLRCDIVLVPVEGAAPEEVEAGRGWGRLIVETRSVVELYSKPPSGVDLRRSIQKYLNHSEEAPAEEALWLICAQRSESLKAQLRATAIKGLPTGFYRFEGIGVQRLIVVEELPETPDTLFLRLFGRGPRLHTALQAVLALPTGHPLREDVLPMVERFHHELTERQIIEPLDPDDQEFFTFTQETLHAFLNERRLQAQRELELKLEQERQLQQAAEERERRLQQAVEERERQLQQAAEERERRLQQAVEEQERRILQAAEERERQLQQAAEEREQRLQQAVEEQERRILQAAEEREQRLLQAAREQERQLQERERQLQERERKLEERARELEAREETLRQATRREPEA